VDTRVIYCGDYLEQGKAAGGFSVNTPDSFMTARAMFWSTLNSSPFSGLQSSLTLPRNRRSIDGDEDVLQSERGL
jgi:hypothetical protein